MRELGVQCRRASTPRDAADALNSLSMALILVPPIPSVSVLDFARRSQHDSLGVPLFVVMQGPLPTRSVRALYRGGVEAVFEWPSEAQALRRTVFRLSSPSVARWGRDKSATEVALEETARMHLSADAVPFGARLRVEAHKHFLILKGSLDALWKLELARQILSEIPGVEDVVAEGVQISGQSRSDRAISRAIRTVLANAASVEPSTLAVSVQSGEVALTGTVRDEHEASRALEIVRNVRGVRCVDDYLVVSRREKKNDKALARRVREVLQTRFPKAPVHVSVFGPVAVLAGRVSTAATRDQMKKLVRGQRGVRRIVDKLVVSGRAAGR
jgi:osmotically-inducible protein OsmY